MPLLRTPARSTVRRTLPAPTPHRGEGEHHFRTSLPNAPRFSERTMCEYCGAAYLHKTWRRGRRRVALLPPIAVKWAVCPACQQVAEGRAQGRVVLRGPGTFEHEEAIRLRVANVADRAGFTQPERRLVSIDREGDAIEVLTTSQKLAHRIVRELLKAFGGRARYAWDDRDGSLFAVWDLDRRRNPGAPTRSRVQRRHGVRS